MPNYCEDYPACGHTPEDPCARQWYDEPDAFNIHKNPHAFCHHEEGDCDVEDTDEDTDHNDRSPDPYYYLAETDDDPSYGERPDQDQMGLS